MKQDTVFQIRLSAERKAIYLKAAGGLPLAAWIKQSLDKAAGVITIDPKNMPVITEKECAEVLVEAQANFKENVITEKPIVNRLKGQWKPD